MQRNLAHNPEPHPKVEIDGSTVFTAHVEPRHKPVAAMIPYQFPNQLSSKAFAAMCGMRADAADLRISVKHEAFSAHGDQFAIRSSARSYSIIGTHLTRPLAKESRERKVRQRNHL